MTISFGLFVPRSPIQLRLEELIESPGSQTGFQFLVIGPEPGVKMQRRAKNGVSFKSIIAKVAGLHPDADRNARGLGKLKRFEEFIEGFEQLVFGETCRGGQAVAVFEKFHKKKCAIALNIIDQKRK